jgi:hypothetical protein
MNAKVNITRVHKTFAALGMALFFTFGAIAVSRAHDVPPSGPSHAAELHNLLKKGPVQLDARALPFGLVYETASVPHSAQPELEEYRVCFSRHIDRVKTSIRSQTLPQKVPFQILKSVLLI